MKRISKHHIFRRKGEKQLAVFVLLLVLLFAASTVLTALPCLSADSVAYADGDNPEGGNPEGGNPEGGNANDGANGDANGSDDDGDDDDGGDDEDDDGDDDGGDDDGGDEDEDEGGSGGYFAVSVLVQDIRMRLAENSRIEALGRRVRSVHRERRGEDQGRRRGRR